MNEIYKHLKIDCTTDEKCNFQNLSSDSKLSINFRMIKYFILMPLSYYYYFSQ